MIEWLRGRIAPYVYGEFTVPLEERAVIAPEREAGALMPVLTRIADHLAHQSEAVEALGGRIASQQGAIDGQSVRIAALLRARASTEEALVGMVARLEALERRTEAAEREAACLALANRRLVRQMRRSRPRGEATEASDTTPPTPSEAAVPEVVGADDVGQVPAPTRSPAAERVRRRLERKAVARASEAGLGRALMAMMKDIPVKPERDWAHDDAPAGTVMAERPIGRGPLALPSGRADAVASPQPPCPAAVAAR